MQLFPNLYIFTALSTHIHRILCDVLRLMLQQKLPYKNSIINYYEHGNGEKILFCIHGYGESGDSFSFLEKHLSGYTVYAIDLPFHGATEWNEKRPMLKQDLTAIINLINTKQNKSFSLMAFSMGGRIALSLIADMCNQIENVALIAPDGLHVNFWYWMATKTLAGNKVFENTVHNPKWFFKVVTVADKTNLLNKSIIKFVHHFLDDETERTLLFRRWNVMKKFTVNRYEVKRLCRQKNIHVNLLFGKHDSVILASRAKAFRNTKNITIKVINAGHHLLEEAYAGDIVSLLDS